MPAWPLVEVVAEGDVSTIDSDEATRRGVCRPCRRRRSSGLVRLHAEADRKPDWRRWRSGRRPRRCRGGGCRLCRRGKRERALRSLDDNVIIGAVRGSRHLGGRTELGQKQLSLFVRRIVGLSEGILIEVGDPFRLVPFGLCVLVRKCEEGKAPRLPLPHFLALPQKLAKRRLRSGVLLLRGSREPVDGKAWILLHSLAAQIKKAELILRLGVAEIARCMAIDIGGIGRIGGKRHGRNSSHVILA